ncbi:hypothetical protein [Litorimonas haliclonae]|uniref:hypothetical protein n=1 Tax=Litorimonas haliclonae TaxID=2081977 RepID=UPI0039EFA6C4
MSDFVENTEAAEFKQAPKTYEYRVWDSSVTLTQDELEASFGQGRHETRTDVYLPPLRDCLPKFRGQSRLELKERLDKVDGIEIWKRSVSSGFPISDLDLKHFQPCVPQLTLSTETFREAENALGYFRERLELLPIKKSRTLYGIDIRGKIAAEIELTAVSINGKNYQTLAIECSDHQSALNLASELDLRREENISYADWIKKLSG